MCGCFLQGNQFHPSLLPLMPYVKRVLLHLSVRLSMKLLIYPYQVFYEFDWELVKLYLIKYFCILCNLENVSTGSLEVGIEVGSL